MSDERENRAKQVFHEALEQTGAARDQFVAAACGNDVELRARVERLLVAYDEAGSFLGSGPTRETAIPPQAPGTIVGVYKLLQVIGEGGFGVVYMAEQDKPIQRRVALKIIKQGMDTKEVIARFEAERQALAMMDHPNIAKVFDAGATESGRPYFVMELVKGVPITEYCDANHLTTRERLRLFADVCRAIHHAHDKGIIHRDIKPSNVMVTLHDGTPVPKIIDFGVAKATNQRLTEKTLFTAYGQFVGTPAYMSPEQTEMSGLDVDRRSDVYSLGVLLYELLTGTTPFQSEELRARGFLEVMRVIREEDPPTPSARLQTLGARLSDVAARRHVAPETLTKQVRGDLDWIVMKALEKDRQRRYESASELLHDLDRYVRDEPVSARRSSVAYRVKKFAKRRRAALVAAAGVVFAVALGGALARYGGLAAGGVSSSASPVRRLLLDQAGQWNASVPMPDGAHLLRYNLQERGFELVEFGSTRARLLTRGGPDPTGRLFVHHRLAPDGRALAAVVWLGADATREPTPENDGGHELRLFSVGGTGDGKLLAQWGQGHNVQVFGWSPDRAQVWLFAMRPDRKAEIASINVSDGSRRVLKTLAWRSHTQAPSLSPDGTLIAYHDHDTPQSAPDVFLLAADGSREVRVEHPASDSHPMFAPDGSGVVFFSNRKGGDLWFLPVAGGQPSGAPRPVWAEAGPFGEAKVFGDNGRLVYFFATNRWEIYTANVDVTRGTVGAPQHVTPRPGEINNAPAFSPDGRVLAHLRDRGRRLVLRELATGAEREFPIAGPLLAPQLDVCADGRTVLVTGFDTGGYGVFRINIDRGGAERLAIPSVRTVCVGDGQDVVYIQARSGQPAQVRRRSLRNGADTTLYEGTVDHLHLARSLDGGRLAFVALSEDQARLLVMPAAGGSAQLVAVSPVTRIAARIWSEFAGVMWRPDGRELLVVRRPIDTASDAASPETSVWRVPAGGQPATEIGRMRLPAFDQGFYGAWNYALHPDGSRLAFERHAGMVNQYWAIDHLLAYIQSGAAVSVPDVAQ